MHINVKGNNNDVRVGNQSQSTIKRWIQVQFQKEGIHHYPGADKDPKLATGKWDDVSFLGNAHFHYFFFKVKIGVTHNDRDIEFIQFSRWCQRQYQDGTLTLNNQSCEMLAESLIEKISATFPNRPIVVEVFEDNINGAILEYAP